MGNLSTCPFMLCPECQEGTTRILSTTDRRDQTCMACGKIIMKYGKVPTEDSYNKECINKEVWWYNYKKNEQVILFAHK